MSVVRITRMPNGLSEVFGVFVLKTCGIVNNWLAKCSTELYKNTNIKPIRTFNKINGIKYWHSINALIIIHFLSFQFNLLIFVSIVLDEAILFSFLHFFFCPQSSVRRLMLLHQTAPKTKRKSLQASQI